MALSDSIRLWQWRLRAKITFRGPVIKRALPYEKAIAHLQATQAARLRELNQRYPLKPWGRVCNRAEWRENLYILDLLDHHLGPPSGSGCLLDIGCKNGCYLPALATYNNGPCDGVEIDAYRRYLSLACRRDYGEYMAAPFDCRYIPAAVQEIDDRYSLITWFLPFLSETPLKAWGLPAEMLQPESLLRHAYALLEPGGRILIVNQGEREAQLQQNLCARLKLEITPLNRVDSPFSPFKKARFGLIINKPLSER